MPRLIETVLDDPGCSELVVVADACTDGSGALLESLARSEPRLRNLSVAFRNQNRSLDAGVGLAAGEVVLLIDDDVLPGAGLAGAHAARHAGRSALAVLGYMPVADDARRRSVTARLYAEDYEKACRRIDQGEVAVLEGLWTGNLSLRRIDALRVGLYSPGFPGHYHADRDLGYRLEAAGLTGVFDRSLSATHLYRRDRDGFLADAARHGAGLSALHMAHHGRLGPLETRGLDSDLPAPLAGAIRGLGGSRHARGFADAIWAAGSVAAGLRLEAGRNLAARLARRIMRYHGAVCSA